MTSHPSDHRHTVIQLERNPFVDLKWSMSIFIYEDINEILKKLSGVWIDGKVLIPASKTALLEPYELQFDCYIWRGRKPGGMCLLFFLLLVTEKFLNTLVKRKSTACLWMYLPAKDNAGFLALKKLWMGLVYQERVKKMLFEDSNKLSTAFKGGLDHVFF